MKILLVANDTAPSRAFESVASQLTSQGHTVTSSLKNAKTPTSLDIDAVKQSIAEADIIVIGLSAGVDDSSLERQTAETAKLLGKKFGFFADIYGAHNRPQFKELIASSNFLIVIDVWEQGKAQEKFPGLQVIVCENPSWSSFFKPKLDRTASRALISAQDDESVILCPGTKHLALDSHLLGAVVMAVNGNSSRKFHICFVTHPGGKYPKEVLESFAAHSDHKVTIVDGKSIATSDLIPGCDLVISSFSTIGIEAACQRKPVFDYISPLALRNMIKVNGNDEWPPAERRISEQFDDDVHGLKMLIPEYSNPSSGYSRKMIEQQEQHMPGKQDGSLQMSENIIALAKT